MAPQCAIRSVYASAMSSKTGRNDPCPCGSGQKYKRCCLARAEAARLARMEPLLFEALEEPTGDDEWLDGLDVLRRSTSAP